MQPLVTYATALVAITVLTSCDITMPRDIKPIAVQAPVQGIDRSRLASIQLDRVVYNIPRGTEIGAGYSLPFFCPGRGPIYWNAGRVTDRSVSLRDIFFSELTKTNFRVVGDPEKLFEQNRERADFLIGAQVTKIAMNVCNRDRLIWDMRAGLQFGEASVDVMWQVFSNAEQRVVRTLKTQGYAKLEQAMPDGDLLMLENAFAAASANLAADSSFVDLLRRDQFAARTEPPPVRDEVLQLAAVRPLAEPIARNISRIQAASVTILIGDSGHGSGFFISDQGHILTNHHVVGNAATVPVRLSNGATIIGRVLRSHEARDISLIKIDAVGTQPLAVRPKPVEVAEPVYALGTPLDRELSNTLTRGIVNAVRRFEGEGSLPFVQADVSIHPGNSGGPLLDASGNVVGVSVAKFKDAQGINFFVPIGDALEKLRIEIKS